MLLPHVHDCSCGGAVDLIAVHALKVLRYLICHTAVLADSTGILNADGVVSRRGGGRASVLSHANCTFSIDDGQTSCHELAMQRCRRSSCRSDRILRHESCWGRILDSRLGINFLALVALQSEGGSGAGNFVALIVEMAHGSQNLVHLLTIEFFFSLSLP